MTSVAEAEDLGFWGFVMPDHYMWGRMGGDATLETWTALAFLAARTKKIKLGTLVTPIPFRPPGILAKTISTLDIISNGRTVLGVGAGWSPTEFEGYSVWDPPKIRVEKTEEGLQLILKLWHEPKVDFNGKYYHAKGAVLEPKTVQKPHPPLLFGGTGTRMLRMAGKYGDICMISPFGERDPKEAKRVVLDEANRHNRAIKVSFAGIAPLPQQNPKYDGKMYEDAVEKAVRLGCEYFVAPFPEGTYLESMRSFAKAVMPKHRN